MPAPRCCSATLTVTATRTSPPSRATLARCNDGAGENVDFVGCAVPAPVRCAAGGESPPALLAAQELLWVAPSPPVRRASESASAIAGAGRGARCVVRGCAAARGPGACAHSFSISPSARAVQGRVVAASGCKRAMMIQQLREGGQYGARRQKIRLCGWGARTSGFMEGGQLTGWPRPQRLGQSH